MSEFERETFDARKHATQALTLVKPPCVVRTIEQQRDAKARRLQREARALAVGRGPMGGAA